MDKVLKELRVKKGYTQEEMARKVGYSGKSGYSMLENGHVKMTVERAKKIADVLDISPMVFFEGKVQATSTNR